MLVNLSAAAEQAAQCAAALGAPLRVHLALVNVYQPPLPISDVAIVATPHFPQQEAETKAALQAIAQRLPVPAEVTVLMAPMPDAVQEVITRFHPLLLAMGLSAEKDLLDYMLRNHALPVLRATHRPLLLVPEASPPPARPRHVLVAVDNDFFALSASSLALAPLLASWQATFSVMHVRKVVTGIEQPGRYGQLSGPLRELLPQDAPGALYDDDDHDPAAVVLRAVAEEQPDLLILIARPRSFLGRLFHRSVTAQVLHGCPVPVLLLPANAPDQPDYMPSMS
ncbi:hypothetical protein BEN48_07860 [Hymenobacter glacialis]|uniref:UspA domain-containing protein n=1 Tax=Hymenobacter glacialis TaxID=1908236 RepID=A0A1G1TDB2_9BACT|nr:hypothetical protein BEN48_07860 [Hymenobacter glacialis]